jgi:TIR domain/Tetratricopeptide repeat/NB-ARC domain
VSNRRRDFFINHTGRDRAWAEWVAWHLTDAGYHVELDVWDPAGPTFGTQISDALNHCDRVLGLWSAEYVSQSRYTSQEWSGDFAHGSPVETARLVLLRIEKVPSKDVPGIVRPLLFRDLFGMEESEACVVLLEAVARSAQTGQAPAFSGRGTPGQLSRMGASGPRLPGTVPKVWNVPDRNPGFTGRDTLLVTLRDHLTGRHRAVVQGIGGIGKTQLAIEYAHRFANVYDVVWWVSAGQSGLIMNEVAALASELDCAHADAPATTIVSVQAELRTRGRWLLIFDDAENQEAVAPWLPGGASGHVLITTRHDEFHEIAADPVEVGIFARRESVAVLRERIPGLTDADADSLAGELGDLPLAIAQAASHMADSGMPAASYLDLVQTEAARILDQGQLATHPHTLSGVIQLAIERLAGENAAAAMVAEISAFLAAQPIPLALFKAAVDQLPLPFSSGAADNRDWRELLSALRRSALARVDQDYVEMHLLTQAILRDRLTPERAALTRARAEGVLVANDPGDPGNPASWSGWAELLPHILAINPAASNDPDLRGLACRANGYLLMLGARSGHDTAEHLHQEWLLKLGDDDRHTLWAASNLAEALRQKAQYAEARDLDLKTLAYRRLTLGEDHRETLSSASRLAVDLRRLQDYRGARELDDATLARYCRVLGQDHPDTLMSATNLAADLRALDEHHAARELDEDTLARRRQVLGDDHPDTLSSGSNLAADLRRLGNHQKARELDEDTLARRRQVLGEDHPDTLISAFCLGTDLRALEEYETARELDADTLARRRRMLGQNHPDTLKSASNLAADLRALREHRAARELVEDTLVRRRRVLGEDDPSTLVSAVSLADDLTDMGEHQAARELYEDTLARRLRRQGANHRDTLDSAIKLAAALRRLDEYRAAGELDQDTLIRYRQLLGHDHPATLRAASNLADDLRALNRGDAARELDEDTLARRRRVLGEDHPNTLISAINLAADLRMSRDYRVARELDEDTLGRARRVLGEDHPTTLMVAECLAADLRGLGETEA